MARNNGYTLRAKTPANAFYFDFDFGLSRA